jgi:hypothetical protein
LEWDRLKATDLLLVLNSFKPPTGTILSVAVYLSDFGAEQLEQEEAGGPPPLATQSSAKCPKSQMSVFFGNN